MARTSRRRGAFAFSLGDDEDEEKSTSTDELASMPSPIPRNRPLDASPHPPKRVRADGPPSAPMSQSGNVPSRDVPAPAPVIGYVSESSPKSVHAADASPALEEVDAGTPSVRPQAPPQDFEAEIADMSPKKGSADRLLTEITTAPLPSSSPAPTPLKWSQSVTRETEYQHAPPVGVSHRQWAQCIIGGDEVHTWIQAVIWSLQQELAALSKDIKTGPPSASKLVILRAMQMLKEALTDRSLRLDWTAYAPLRLKPAGENVQDALNRKVLGETSLLKHKLEAENSFWLHKLRSYEREFGGRTLAPTNDHEKQITLGLDEVRDVCSRRVLERRKAVEHLFGLEDLATKVTFTVELIRDMAQAPDAVIERTISQLVSGINISGDMNMA